MKIITSTVGACLVVILLALIIFTPKNKCEHEEVATWYSFAAYNQVNDNSVTKVCKDCGDKATGWARFKGTPIDKSYLSAIQEHSDGREIVPGEYYTVTATVPAGFYGYLSPTVWLACRVENADYIVGFTVEFREEFKEAVESVGEGAEITFRGRFYDEGCGFTDAEVINIK